MADPKPPQPLFDTLENLTEHMTHIDTKQYPYALHDYPHTYAYLKSYNGSPATFNAYRREVERLLHWSWIFANKSVIALRRADLEQYLDFCRKPPKSWIGLVKTPRFIEQGGARIPNPKWRPFVVTLSKVARRLGKNPTLQDYVLSDNAFKEIFAILSSFYNFLIQEEVTEVNPISHIRQKSKYIRKQQGQPKIRRLSEKQWEYVIQTAELMAVDNPAKHERTLFMMSALYTMYLRISELAASDRWMPKMCDFHRDHDNHWWFTVVGKGNKERQIPVSDVMLMALKRWRVHLNLPPLPSPADTSPLIPKVRGHGAISNTSFIRKIVQSCFDQAITRLHQDGFNDEAQALNEATVHWLRHTGISDDVKHRPREHVRDDAGHSSSAITDRYIDIELRERHASAKDKPIDPSE